MKQTDPQFKLRIPPELKAKLDAAANANQRSISAEIVQRLSESFEMPGDVFLLQHELKTLREVAPLHRLYVLLDTSGHPISWAQIHETVSSICEAGDLNAVEMRITVVTPELVSSSARNAEADDLARKLRKLNRSGPIDELEREADDPTVSIPSLDTGGRERKE